MKFLMVFRRLMEEKKLPLKPLVAFSGEVTDSDSSLKYT